MLALADESYVARNLDADDIVREITAVFRLRRGLYDSPAVKAVVYGLRFADAKAAVLPSSVRYAGTKQTIAGRCCRLIYSSY